METLTEFERAVLDKLLAGDHPVLASLRAQAQAAHLTSREYTGAGFFLSFDIPPEVPLVVPGRFYFGDVSAVVNDLQYGAGFVVYVREGRLHTLEGYSYEEPWPNEIRSFELAYQREPRKIDIPES